MPPKRRPRSDTSPNSSKRVPQSKSKADQVDEAPLQAVILADSYNRRFEVLCQDTPRVLLPLCSTPLLAWTLESLSLSKVKQVFVFCGAHADKIRAFVATSPLRGVMDIQCLSSTKAFSAGAALRELDDMNVLNAESPFILVHSPLISNYDISKMVEAHKARRETDKNFIMTMGVGRGGRRHPESPIMLVHPPSSRLLFYAQNPLSPRQSKVAIPASLFLDPFPTNIDTYELWSGTSSSSSQPHAGGYRDLGVDICEAEVPALCTENFDFHDLRRNLVDAVLTSELLGKKIAVHLVGQEDEAVVKGKGEESGRYIDRVRDTRTFGEVTRDVLRRWAFPLVPDLNEPGLRAYELRKGNVYVARDNVVLSRSTILRGPCLIGPRSSLNNDTTIHQSTLGDDCSIGPHTKIISSYIFDDVRIGANCHLEDCMVGKGVHIADGVTVGRGALIGGGVKLGKGVIIPDYARIGRERFDADEDEDEEEGEGKVETAGERQQHLDILGPDSLGYLWPNEEEEPSSDSEDEGEDPYEHPRNKRLLQLGRSLSNLSEISNSLSTLSKASETPPSSPASMTSTTSLPDVTSLNLNAGPVSAFYTEIQASLARAVEEDHDVTNALLEIRTLVLGYNAGVDRARQEVVRFLCGTVDFEAGTLGVLERSTRVFGRWGKLVEGFTKDLTAVILDVQTYCIHNPTHIPHFPILLRGLYESDLVPEEDLLEWREMSSARGEGIRDGEEKKRWEESYEKGKVYVDALEGMDSDEEDDEDEDEEGEESD